MFALDKTVAACLQPPGLAHIPTPQFDAAPWRLSGTVYAALLDDPAVLDALGDVVRQPPYKAAPRAPVLAVRPRNTLASSGAVFTADGHACTLGATIGIVIGRTACAVSRARAPQSIAGCVLVADLSLPTGSHYRPAVQLRARDASCVIGPCVAALDIEDLQIDVFVDGDRVQRIGFDHRVRSPAALLADVSDFMTLRPGDLLLMGSAHGAPLLNPGQRYTVACEGLGRLDGTVA